MRSSSQLRDVARRGNQFRDELGKAESVMEQLEHLNAMMDAQRENERLKAQITERIKHRAPFHAVMGDTEFVRAVLDYPMDAESQLLAEKDAAIESLVAEVHRLKTEHEAFLLDREKERSMFLTLVTELADALEGWSECIDCIGMKREHGCYCAAVGAAFPGGPLKSALIQKAREAVR